MIHATLKRNFFLFSTAAMAIALTGVSAKADTVHSASAFSTETIGTTAIDLIQLDLAQASPGSPATPMTPGQIPEQIETPTSPNSATDSGTGLGTDLESPGTALPESQSPDDSGLTTPDRVIPRTGSDALNPDTAPGTIEPPSDTGTTAPAGVAPQTIAPETPNPPSTTSQTPDRTPPGTFTPDTTGVSPGRATRSGSSYVGIGGNIGLGDGDTALGEGSFAVFSKIGLTSNISVRPSVLVSDDPTILVPLTLDFIPLVTRVTEDLSERVGLRVSPYIGAGAAISTGDDSTVDFLATGGVDVPLSAQLTATASVSATLFDNPAVGLLLGIGYNF